MKKTFYILILGLVQFSCNQSKNDRELYLDNFKADLEMLLDSSVQYLDKGIKLLKQDVDPAEIAALIGTKLEDFRKEINAKSKAFSADAPKLKILEEEYKKVFMELQEFSQKMREKYSYLIENGVEINQ